MTLQRTATKETICKSNRGYLNLTENKKYEVIEMLPQLITPHFTFPRYITVIDDNEKETTAHAHRFTTICGKNMDDYIKEHKKDTIEGE